MYSQEFIAKVRSAVDIASLVGETVQLRRSGKSLVGLSPFTKEKTASFHVHPDKGTYYCFSTSQGGDVFQYIMATKGMSFPESVAFLAQKAGLELEQINRTPEEIAAAKKRAEERKVYLTLNQFAARFYQETLEGPLGGPARDYVKRRQISPDSLLQFAIGYAPDGWTSLLDYFVKIKAPLIPAYEIGLFRTRGGEKPKEDGSNFIDAYRSRLIFPIRGPEGDVLGFGGRYIGPADPKAPKYINSPETPLYEKDKVLYNVDQARKSIREMETTVLVEGYMDCLALVQAGFPNAVANCGTALTRTQVGMLRKLAPKVICLFDSDKAGQAAMEKAMDLFLDAEGVPVLGARLPDGKDPDEFLREHGEDGQLRMAEILQNSPALVDTWIETQVKESSTSLQGKTDTLNKIAAKLAKLRDDLSIQARLPGLAKALELDQELLIEAVRKHKKSFMADRAPIRPAGSSSGTARTLPPSQPRSDRFSGQKNRQFQAPSVRKDFGFQRRFLGDLLRNPTWIESLRKLPAPDLATVLSQVDDVGIQQALNKILEPLQPHESDGERVSGLLNVFRDQPEIRNLIAEATLKPDDTIPAAGPENLEEALKGALKRLKEEFLKKKAADLQERLRKAEESGDHQASEALLQELTELRRQRANG